MHDKVVIGFRTWKIDPETSSLKGPVRDTPWPPDQKISAYCNPFPVYVHHMGYTTLPIVEGEHVSPHLDCTCGLYAFHDAKIAEKEFSSNSLTILGVAAFWGKIEIHTTGFRAQYGRILALADHKDSRPDHLGFDSLLEQVVARYGIPVIPVDLLTQYGLTFGELIGTQFDEE